MSNWLKNNKRTNMCGELREVHAGKEIIVTGWVERKRNLSSLIFLTLRDRTGVLQIAFNEEKNVELYNIANSIKPEYCIGIKGMLAVRESKNSNMPTGDVEIIASEIEIFSTAKTSPIDIRVGADTDENLRLKYRYLDLRRQDMQQIFKIRSDISMSIREYLSGDGFLEVETPILTKSTPEGARDYLVPSRKNEGMYYALPQSPQIFKQLLMLSNFDKYYQIAKCFRDEDLRANRQPEFTQIDIEMSFVEQEDVIVMAEGMIKKVFKDVLNHEIQLPIDRITYEEAMERFGSDKPDLRFDMEITDISSEFIDSEFKLFSDAIKDGGSVKAIYVKGGASIGRKDIDKFGELVKQFKAKALAFIALKEDGVKSSISKFLSEKNIEEIKKKGNAQTGDLILIVGDKNSVVHNSLGELRLSVARKMGLLDGNKDFKFVWVTDFPMFEWGEEAGRYTSCHHPFTHPKVEDIQNLDKDPGSVKSIAYDLVLNGEELGGGSIRIHDSNLQEKVFKSLGFTEKEANEKFGFFIDAFKYGAPPHGGIAFGLDRLVMSIAGTENIKDVIAFPKNQNAYCPLTDAPNLVDEKQLKELGIIQTK